jgi:hypothetical protein
MRGTDDTLGNREIVRRKVRRKLAIGLNAVHFSGREEYSLGFRSRHIAIHLLRPRQIAPGLFSDNDLAIFSSQSSDASIIGAVTHSDTSQLAEVRFNHFADQFVE